MLNDALQWFGSIPAKRWGQIGVLLLCLYVVMGIVLAYFPSTFDILKRLWFVWGPPGFIVWAMALWRVITETLEHA